MNSSLRVVAPLGTRATPSLISSTVSSLASFSFVVAVPFSDSRCFVIIRLFHPRTVLLSLSLFSQSFIKLGSFLFTVLFSSSRLLILILHFSHLYSTSSLSSISSPSFFLVFFLFSSSFILLLFLLSQPVSSALITVLFFSSPPTFPSSLPIPPPSLPPPLHTHTLHTEDTFQTFLSYSSWPPSHCCCLHPPSSVLRFHTSIAPRSPSGQRYFCVVLCWRVC